MESGVWERFALDPRHPDNAGMRAADSDREIVRGVLTEAYADGKLDSDELDQRGDELTGARTLGELPPLISDLIPDRTPVRRAAAPLQTADLHEQAVARYERERREHLMAWLAPTMITWVIWSLTMFGGFPWPAIVTVATFIPLGRDLVTRKDIIADHEKSIGRKQAKQEAKDLARREERRQPWQLPPGEQGRAD